MGLPLFVVGVLSAIRTFRPGPRNFRFAGDTPLELLKLHISLGKPPIACKDFHFRGKVGSNINEVVEADELVMENVLKVTPCVAHDVIEKV
jgi:hypothetical protein